MPYKFETNKIKLDSPFLDRRVKLLPCQKEMVLFWTEQGLSQRKIAKMFNVSRRLITFVQDPKKKEKDLENRKDRGGSSQYYKGGDEWAATIREHRRYKQKIIQNMNH
jgi:transposase